MEPPLKQKPQFVFPDGKVVDIGEFNVSYIAETGTRTVIAADDYTVLEKDSKYATEMPEHAVGVIHRFSAFPPEVVYEYVIVTEFQEVLNGWVMQRVDDMPRTEPRRWNRYGEIVKPADKLAQIEAANQQATAAARAIGRAEVPALGSGPRTLTAGLPSHQILLVFSCEDDRDSFLAWFSDKGSDAWRAALG